MLIGVDVGGAKIEAAALEDDGRTLARGRAATPRDYEGLLAAVAGSVAGLEARFGRSDDPGGRRMTLSQNVGNRWSVTRSGQTTASWIAGAHRAKPGDDGRITLVVLQRRTQGQLADFRRRPISNGLRERCGKATCPAPVNGAAERSGATPT